MAWSEKAIEAAARRIAAVGGSDPDQLTSPENEPTAPLWTFYRREAAAALDAAAAVDGDAGWMPIETARKDGKKVDLWIIPPLGQLSSGACRITDCWFYNGEWRTEDAGAPEGWASVIWEPTHWMPLPAPPSAH